MAKTEKARPEWAEWIKTRLLQMQVEHRTFRGAGQILAEQLGVTRATVSSWVVGRTPPNQDNARAIARYFGDETILRLLGYSSNDEIVVQIMEVVNRLTEDDRAILLGVINRYRKVTQGMTNEELAKRASGLGNG